MVGLAVCTVIQHVLTHSSAVAVEGRKTARRARRVVVVVGRCRRRRDQLLRLEVAEVADEGGLVTGAAPSYPDRRAFRLHSVNKKKLK